MEELNSLAQSVTNINVDGRDIYLVGTAHVSKQSVDDVHSTVKAVNPDTICIELCDARHRAMLKQQDWEKMNIFKVIKEKKAGLLLAQLIMTAFYRKLGEKLDVKPGAEMLAAIEEADETKANLVLADRDIDITLKRVWGYLNFWNKLKMTTQLLAALLFSEKIDEKTVEDMKQQDQLEGIMETFAKSFPEIKKRLIDERDIYLAQKIRHAGGQKIVAVVGAGHIKGICEHIKQDEPLDELIKIPKKSIWPKIFKWIIPAAIIAIIAYGFLKDGTAHSVQNIYIWIFVNGILSAIGAAIAMAHPITILSAFFGAPITSLNPFMAAGWVAGLVQAWISKPTVADFKDLKNATASVKGFWSNPITKILLVVALANLGSAIGTWVAAGWISGRTF